MEEIKVYPNVTVKSINPVSVESGSFEGIGCLGIHQQLKLITSMGDIQFGKTAGLILVEYIGLY
ncbi:hypothetical protein C5167_029602 [Papaver somniferum]|nr:hypothetical protein C5167_029602 [Papaver somniferum]